MWRPNKREINKTAYGSAGLVMTRTESAFEITCCSCGRTGEALEVEIDLPKALAQSTITFTRLPDGWWQEGTMILIVKANCPGCMEAPLALPQQVG